MTKGFAQKIGVWIIAITLSAGGTLALAQSPEIEKKLSETKDDIQKLATIKDDATLSDEQKTLLEIELKKNIITDVIDVAKTQITHLQKQIEIATLPKSEEWKRIKEHTIKSLDEALVLLEENRATLLKENSLEKIKAIAKETEIVKTETIDPLLAQVNAIVVTASINTILNLTNQRLEKIGMDINKIYEKKLTKNQSLRKMLEQATLSAKNAHSHNDQAKEIMVALYDPEKSTSTKLYLDNLEKNLKNKGSEATSTIEKNEDSTTKQTLKIHQHVEELITSSLAEIKKTYDTFIKMSANVKSYLK